MFTLRTKLALTCFGIGLAAVIGSAQVAHAGGCSRTPDPGDYLNCAPNGPYGPSGPNFVNCLTACSALRTCLNSRPTPPANCSAEQTALDNCMRNGGAQPIPPGQRAGISLPSVTVAFAPGMGCVLVNSGSMASGRKGSSLESLDNPTAQFAASQLHMAECKLVSAVPYSQSYNEQQSNEVAASSLVKRVVSERLGVSEASLVGKADLYSDLGASWDDVRAIANDFGRLFAVTIDDDVINNLNTMDDVTNCVRQASSGKVF